MRLEARASLAAASHSDATGSAPIHAKEQRAGSCSRLPESRRCERMAPDRESAYEAPDDRDGHAQAADRIAGGTALGLEGLRSAIERLHLASEQILSGGGATPSAIALGEALFWIAALDDYFKI